MIRQRRGRNHPLVTGICGAGQLINRGGEWVDEHGLDQTRIGPREEGEIDDLVRAFKLVTARMPIDVHRHAFPGKASKRNFEASKLVGARCGQFCQDEGVIVRPLISDRIALCPPLVISEAEIGELFDRFERGLNKTLDWAKAEKLLPV